MAKVTLSKLPKTIEELKDMSELDFHKPETVVAFVVAAYTAYGDDPEAVHQMIDYLNGPNNVSVYDQQFTRDRLKGKEYVPFSYFEGATVENNYTPSEPYVIEISENPYSRDQIDQGYLTLWVQSSGADSPRQIRLRHKASTDEWFLQEQMILGDIRIPKNLDPWA